MRNTRALSILTLAAALAAATACGHKETFEEHQQHELADNLKKAETGDTQAMYEAASAYENGWGTPQDFSKAMTWYLKAVDKGDHSAMFNIGTMYREGKGVPKDANQAVAWYTKSANAGESVAMYNLGMMYYKGDEIPANREQALIWLKKFLPGQNPDGTLAKEANKAIADMEGR